MIYTARFNAGDSSGTAIGHSTFLPRFSEDLFSLDDHITRSIHADSDPAAFDIQDGQGDAVSDHQSFGQPAGQNEHDPLPLDVICSDYARITIIVSGHYCVQGSNLVVCVQDLSFKRLVMRFGTAAASGT
jgi:hypothetical protein